MLSDFGNLRASRLVGYLSLDRDRIILPGAHQRLSVFGPEPRRSLNFIVASAESSFLGSLCIDRSIYSRASMDFPLKIIPFIGLKG